MLKIINEYPLVLKNTPKTRSKLRKNPKITQKAKRKNNLYSNYRDKVELQ